MRLAVLARLRVMWKQVEKGLLVVGGFCIGMFGTFSCMGGGWIFVAGLLWGLNKQNSPRMMYLKIGLSLGLVLGIVAIVVMGAMGMIGT